VGFNFVNMLAGFIVLRWAFHQVLAMIGGLLLLIILACAGVVWPLLAATVLLLFFWALASLVWRLVFGRPQPRGASLEELCAAERRIQEHARGFTFSDNGLRADARSRLSPR
jgi:hypothetical protein